MQVHRSVLVALSEAFGDEWSSRSHSEWVQTLRVQNPSVTSRVTKEVLLPNGAITWVNSDAQGDFIFTGQEARDPRKHAQPARNFRQLQRSELELRLQRRSSSRR